MQTYVDLYFTWGKGSALDVAKTLETRLGLKFLRGRHDLVFEWKDVEEFREWTDRIHEALRGMSVYYRFITSTEEGEARWFVGWPPVGVPAERVHQGFHH